MPSVFTSLLTWLRGLFWSKEMEITIVGLQNSGKTSLVNVLAAGQFSDSMVPTVGFNMRKVTKGAVTIKLWDIGGQPRFRSMWERYCRGVSAILFILDSADPSAIDVSRAELQSLVEKPELRGVPLLVLGNKSDLEGSCGVRELIERLQLSKVSGREVSIYSISAKESHNLDVTLQWILKRA